MWAKRSLTISFIVIVSVFGLSLTFTSTNVQASTLYVGGIGPGNYTSIQDAVLNASDGDTVFVYNGTYGEQVTVTKTINLIGLDRDTTIIKVNKSGRAVFVTSDWVNISGFTMLALPDPPIPTPEIFGIVLHEVEHCRVENVRFQTNRIGLFLFYSHRNLVANNTMINNQDGVYLTNSNANAILNSTLISNTVAGIRMAYSSDNVISGNNASGNGGEGMYIFSSSSNIIYHNYLFGNLGQGFDDGDNCWDGCYPAGGNYFSDYAGVDAMSGPGQDVPGSDGIGDTAYAIPGDSNADRYPLMSPAYFPTVPSPPINVQAMSGDEHVNLSWELPVFDGQSTITNYSVYRTNGTGGEVLLDRLGTVYEYSDLGLTNGETYRYRITATNAQGEGCKSEEVLAVPATVPGPPQGLIAQAGIERITLTWLPPAGNGGSTITNYTLYRGLSSGAETYLVTLGNTLTHTDSGLVGEQEYFYRITATNGVGEGSMSNEASGTALMPPPNEPPVCGIDSPETGAVVFGFAQIAGTADDLDGDVESVEIGFDNGTWIQVFGTSFWTYDWNTTQVSDGYHTISARSFDGEDYSEVEMVIVSVDNYIPSEESQPDPTFYYLALVVLVVVAIVLILWGVMKDRKRKKSVAESEIPNELKEHEE